MVPQHRLHGTWGHLRGHPGTRAQEHPQAGRWAPAGQGMQGERAFNLDPQPSPAALLPWLATHCRMNWMASSYFIPLSMRARATRTGALQADGRAGRLSLCVPPLPLTGLLTEGCPDSLRRPSLPWSSARPPSSKSRSLPSLCDLRWAKQPSWASGSLCAQHVVGGLKAGEQSSRPESGGLKA